MHPFLIFLSQTRLWLIPLGIVWLMLMAVQNEQGYSRFQTVDAAYYKELSLDFVDGRPMVIDDLTNSHGNGFSPYPPGYPVLLGISSVVTSNGTWLNHVFLHAVLLILLVLIWQNSVSLLPLGFVVFSDSALSLASMGISEFSFLISCVLVVFCLSKVEQRGEWIWQIGLILSLCSCISIRYAGLFFLPFLVFRMFQRPGISLQKIRTLLWPIFYFMVFSIFLFGAQWMDSGQLTGGDRYPNTDSSGRLLIDWLIEMINQFAFLRNLSGSSLLIFSAGVLCTLLMLWMTVKLPVKNAFSVYQPKDELHNPFLELLSSNLIHSGIFYLLGMSALRWFFYFAETFDTRLLGPGGCLIWLGWAVSMESRITRLPLGLKLLFVVLAALFFLPVGSMVNNL